VITWPSGEIVGQAIAGRLFGNSFLGRVVEEIPAPGVWDYASSSFHFYADMAFTDAKEGATLNATDTDLRAFRKQNHKGKIIIWHGWEDPAISALSTVNYFPQVVRRYCVDHVLASALLGS
jgi:feruloyl esterase